MSKSIKSTYSPESPPYTMDLRSFIMGGHPSFLWQPPTSITLVDTESNFEFQGTGALHFARTTKGFEVVGTLTGKALVPCSQCIGNTWVEDAFEIVESFRVKSTFDDEESSVAVPKYGSKLELHPQDFDEPVDLTLPFALGELLRQVLITQLPTSSGCVVEPVEQCPSFCLE
jgi:hypothetical protein